MVTQCHGFRDDESYPLLEVCIRFGIQQPNTLLKWLKKYHVSPSKGPGDSKYLKGSVINMIIGKENLDCDLDPK